MSSTTPPDQTGKSTNKKAGNKAGSSTIMDEAPLFAGLDDFVLPLVVKNEAVKTRADQPKEKKKTPPRPKKQTQTVDSVPQAPPVSTPKPSRAQLTDNTAVLLSVTEMCSLLSISRATLVRMDKSGKIPGRIKLGGSVRFHRATVETWLQSLIATHPTA